MASPGVDLAFNRLSWYLEAPFQRDGEARDRITIGEEPIQGGVIRFMHYGRMKSRSVCSREKARASDAPMSVGIKRRINVGLPGQR